MKTFSQLKASFLSEASKVKGLVGKSKEDLEKLHYSKFPSESDPELKDLSFKERIAILSAKDAVFAASKDLIAKDKSKVSRALFKKAGAAVGDYTTLGLVSKVTKDGVVFNAGEEVPFSARLATGINPFENLKKISKAAYTKQVKAKVAGHNDLMADFAKHYRLD